MVVARWTSCEAVGTLWPGATSPVFQIGLTLSATLFQYKFSSLVSIEYFHQYYVKKID